jgi:predicted nucleic acid-binding protein
MSLLVSGQLLGEIAETLLELGADHDDVPIKHQRMGCDDEEDDHLLETALTGKAGYLVSEGPRGSRPAPARP